MVGGLSILTATLDLLLTLSRLAHLQKHQQMLPLHPMLPLTQMCTILVSSVPALLASDLARCKGPFRNGRDLTKSAESMVIG
jgi:hypothetical protein